MQMWSNNNFFQTAYFKLTIWEEMLHQAKNIEWKWQNNMEYVKLIILKHITNKEIK